MNSDAVFHFMFSLLFGTVVLLRAVSHQQAGTFRANVLPRTERKLTALLRGVFGIPFLLAICVYIVVPRWMQWAAVPLPDVLRWVGLALGWLAVALLAWIHHALGSNFSPTLRIRTAHQLVLRGPYRWVRHPMYSAMFLLHTAYFLISANWLIGALGIAVISLVVLLRTSSEEAMLVEHFGDDYRAYMERTGRFLPRLDHRQGDTVASRHGGRTR